MRHRFLSLLIVVPVIEMAVSTGVALADDAPSALAMDGRTFGTPGTAALTATALVWQHMASSSLGTDSTQTTGTLAADVFVWPDLSVGLGTSFTHDVLRAQGSSQTANALALSARLGYAQPLGVLATFWPVFSVGASHTSGFAWATPDTVFLAGLDLPVLFHPTRHFYVGTGPHFGLRLGSGEETLQAFGSFLFGGAFG
jgi:hypothetical protein